MAEDQEILFYQQSARTFFPHAPPGPPPGGNAVFSQTFAYETEEQEGPVDLVYITFGFPPVIVIFAQSGDLVDDVADAIEYGFLALSLFPITPPGGFDAALVPFLPPAFPDPEIEITEGMDVLDLFPRPPPAPPPPEEEEGFPFSPQEAFPGISCGMAINEVGIGNMALTHIGAEPVLSFTENSKTARFLCHNYENARDQVLRMHPWGCASKRASLNRLLEPPAWGYTFQFQLPEDWIRNIQIEDNKDDFAIEGDRIFYDFETLNLRYVFRLIDVKKMDTLLQQSIALLLAAKGAVVITGNRELARDLAAQFREMLNLAQQVDAVEGPIEVVAIDDWIMARG